MKKKIIHLLPNAHIDPVWLWDRQEGLSEGIRTCRSMVKLLDEYPSMVFNRGEAAIYDHVAKYDPELFGRILELVRCGRWDAVGGNWVQTDHNLPRTECLYRQLEEGQRYFRKTFGRRAETVWAPDSFGHSAGLPEIFAANGFRYFSFMRPQKFVLPDSLFRWTGSGGSSILCYRLPSYTMDRDIRPYLDRLAESETEGPRRNCGIGFGLGDHGGGTSRRQIEDALAWAEENPGFEVRFSTLHMFFTALEEEIASGLAVPEVTGEINYCLRGCYASLPRFKKHYRQAEDAVLRSVRTCRTVFPLLNQSAPSLETEWRALLFNEFHDILPGTSIGRAIAEQHNQLGMVIDGAFEAECDALSRLAARIDMPVPAPPEADAPEAIPMLIFNPGPYAYRGFLEMEEAMDYRPLYQFRREDPIVELRDAAGRELPVQEIAEEHNAMTFCVWRKRVVFPVELPPLGWKVLTIGAKSVPAPHPVLPGIAAEAVGSDTIRNEFWNIAAPPGKRLLELSKSDGTLLPLSFALCRDDFGSWGGMSEEPDSFHIQELLEEWEIKETRILEPGPLRACIWVRLEGANSHLELTLRLCAGSDSVRAELRVFCRDRACRLKLRLPMAERVVCDVPGGEAERRVEGQFPAVGWLKVFLNGNRSFGFAADGAYGFDNENGFFTYTVIKNTAYASDEVGATRRHPELPVEAEVQNVCFLLSSDAEAVREQGEAQLHLPPRVFACWPHAGTLSSEGSLLSIEPSVVRLIDLAHENGMFRLVLQNCSGQTENARINIMGRSCTVALAPWKITETVVPCD